MIFKSIEFKVITAPDSENLELELSKLNKKYFVMDVQGLTYDKDDCCHVAICKCCEL